MFYHTSSLENQTFVFFVFLKGQSTVLPLQAPHQLLWMMTMSGSPLSMQTHEKVCHTENQRL